MPITFKCPSCDSKLQFPDHWAGRRGHCPSCGIAFITPGGPSRNPPRPAPPPDHEDIPDVLPADQPDRPAVSPALLFALLGAASLLAGGFLAFAVSTADRQRRTAAAGEKQASLPPAPKVQPPPVWAKPPEPPKPPPAEKWTASEVLGTYQINAVSADAQMKGRWLEVAGVVMSVDTDVLGTGYVVLGTGGEFEVFGVQCFFKDKGDLINLRRGQSLTVRGKGAGKVLHVLVKGCELAR